MEEGEVLVFAISVVHQTESDCFQTSSLSQQSWLVGMLRARRLMKKSYVAFLNKASKFPLRI